MVFNNRLIRYQAITAGVLFFISLLVYYNEYHISTALATGSEFLPGIDFNKVVKITIRDKDKKSAELEREQGQFIAKQGLNYPADSEKIFDLFYRISAITLKEEVGKNATPAQFKDYHVAPNNFEKEITLKDAKDQIIVQFYLGKQHGTGTVVRQANKNDLYLTEGQIDFDPVTENYLAQTILKLDPAQIKSLNFLGQGQASYQMIRDPKSRAVLMPGYAATGIDQAKAESAFAELGSLTFIKPYFNDHKLVRNLQFSDALIVQLENYFYKIQMAKQEQATYIKIVAEMVAEKKEIAVANDASEAKLKEVNTLLQDNGAVEKFNKQHSSWVYELSSERAAFLTRAQSDYVAPAPAAGPAPTAPEQKSSKKSKK